jgi:hypothetical protein
LCFFKLATDTPEIDYSEKWAKMPVSVNVDCHKVSLKRDLHGYEDCANNIAVGGTGQHGTRRKKQKGPAWLTPRLHLQVLC